MMQLVMIKPTNTESFSENVRLERLQDLVNNDDQRGYDNELDDDADAVRNHVSKQGDNHVATDHHEQHGQAHDDRLLQLHRNGQCRADAQYLHRDGVGVVQRVNQSFRFFFENNDSFLAVATAVSVLIAALVFEIQNNGGTPSGCG